MTTRHGFSDLIRARPYFFQESAHLLASTAFFARRAHHEPRHRADFKAMPGRIASMVVGIYACLPCISRATLEFDLEIPSFTSAPTLICLVATSLHVDRRSHPLFRHPTSTRLSRTSRRELLASRDAQRRSPALPPTKPRGADKVPDTAQLNALSIPFHALAIRVHALAFQAAEVRIPPHCLSLWIHERAIPAFVLTIPSHVRSPAPYQRSAVPDVSASLPHASRDQTHLETKLTHDPQLPVSVLSDSSHLLHYSSSPLRLPVHRLSLA